MPPASNAGRGKNNKESSKYTRKGDLVKECGIEKFREEYIGYTSISVGFGRIIGYILMLMVSFATDIIYFKILLAVVTLFANL